MSQPKHPKTPEQQHHRQVPNAPRLEHRQHSHNPQAGRVLFPQAQAPVALPAPQTPRRENRALLVVPPAPQKPRRPGR